MQKHLEVLPKLFVLWRMSRSLLWSLLALLLTAISSRAEVLTVVDFETGDLTQMRTQKAAPDSVMVVNSPVRAGRHAAKTLLRSSDPKVSKGQRAEFSDHRTKILMDTDYRYGLSLFLPSEFVAPVKRDAVLFQWHTQQGGPSPVLAIRVKGDEWVITSDAVPGERRTLKRLPLDKGRWTDWAVHVRWASTPTGYWTLWKDGVEVVSEKDIITQYPEALGPYAKFGQYHSVHETSQNIVYVDEYRVAGSGSKIEDVKPGK